MRTEGSLDSRINNLCSIAGYTEDEMQKLGTKLLRIFRDVCRNNKLDADDIIEDLCSDSFESDEYKRMNESLVRLEFFASESTRSRYESDINKTMKTAWMLKVMETLKMNVYSFDGYGPEFVSILTLCYMTSFKYTEQEILAELNISRQNFYKKKKYATILFALEFEEFKQELIREFNDLHIEGMPRVEKLNALVGGYINLEYRLPNGQTVKFLDDSATYLGNQLACEFGGDRCFGIAANMDFLLVCTYGKDGADPELVVYKKR